VRTLSLSVRTAIALAVSAALLGACASSFEASQDRTANIVTGSLPTWAGGEPANIQARSATPPAYPAVNAPIPPRATPALTPEEQSKAVADLVAARNRATSYLSGFGTSQTGGSRRAITVRTTTLDDLERSFSSPDVIKIDVEGAEVPVLCGGAEVLARRPTLLVEVASENADAVDAILRPLGYRYRDAEDGFKPVRRPANNTLAFVDRGT